FSDTRVHRRRHLWAAVSSPSALLMRPVRPRCSQHYSTSAPNWPGIWLIQSKTEGLRPEVEMAITIFLSSMAVVAGVCCWFLQKWLGKAYVRYQQAFKKRASERLDEFFLFVDPAQLW